LIRIVGDYWLDECYWMKLERKKELQFPSFPCSAKDVLKGGGL